MNCLKCLLFTVLLSAGFHLRAQSVESGGFETRVPGEQTVAWSKSDPDPAKPWSLIVAPLVLHWLPSPDHKHAFAVALEHRDDTDDRLVGFSLFRNSFGQPSAYAYWGKRWSNMWDRPDLTFKLTAGVLYGYVGAFKDQVPLNYNGFAPCIVPALLYHLDRDRTVDIMVLGVGGLGFSYTHTF